MSVENLEAFAPMHALRATRLSLRALVLILSYIISRSYTTSNPSKLRHKTRTTHAIQLHSFPPPPPLFLPHSLISLPLISRSWTTLADTVTMPLPHGNCTLSFHPVSVLPYVLTLSLFIPHHRHPRGHLYDTKRRLGR